MFHSARVKLTARYLLIIMLVSALFSLVIYGSVNTELNRFERYQRMRSDQNASGIFVQPAVQIIQQSPNGRGTQIQRFLVPPADEMDPEIVDHARARIIIILVIINLSVLGFSGIAGYLLAGQTLRPIKEMMEEQSRFITDSSHELRTPLTALRAEIEVNLRDKKLDLKTAKELLESNLEEVKNLQQLSDSLIRLTQYENGHGADTFSQVSLSTVVEEATKKILPLAKSKKITIQQRVPELNFEANPTTICELLVILLDNAIKYSKKNTTVSISAEHPDHRIKIMVSDQGNGIEEKELPLLFNRFYRSDKSRTESATQGYGLGLAIAKQIVERHHGTISVSSIINKGTTFTIDLPTRQPGNAV